MKIVDVKMKKIEFACAREDFFQQHEMMRERIHDLFVEPQRPLGTRHQTRPRDRIAAGEQSDIVALPYQFFRKIGDDAFRAAV